MRLIVVSGLSGSGKSVALHMLEDLDYYCVDNIPAALLKPLIAHVVRGTEDLYPRTAVGLDARNRSSDIERVPAMLAELRRGGISCDIIYLHASDEVLLKRYSETRRKHPLVAEGISLREAIAAERALLEPIIRSADLIVDTSDMGVHALRERVRERIDPRRTSRLSLLFESFGYKNGIPGDADFVFDVRSLPNPYWEFELRPLTGNDAAVVRYLEGHAEVGRLVDDLVAFVERRVAEAAAANRRYLTVAVGCTGGQHRSVYVVERLAAHFRGDHPAVMIRHDALHER
ncbi:MAG TPA: RNase adapter RapZ [Steroidobacteraceae bacterium]|nr:RNase adapter RapZ [Steroidobacteraceae bacterium]